MTRNIVYYTDSAAFGGVEQILISLLAGLDRETWHPVLLHHPEPGLVPLLAEARNLRVQSVAVPRMEGPDAIRNLPRFQSTLRQLQPTVFHAQLNWLLSCKFGLLAAALARVPVRMATLHQLLLPPWKANIEWQLRLVAASVHKYFAVSHAVAEQLSHSFRVPSEKIVVIHNGIRVGTFEGPAASIGVEGRRPRAMRPTVLTVARLDEQKGHKYLLEAIKHIPEGIFEFAGSGAERSVLERLAEELGVADRVVFLDHRADIPELLAECDLLVLPSLYEGFPLCILEAMAAGKPVVATAVGGTPEAVVHGVTGMLVPPRDPAALAEAIKTVLSNPTLAARMGASGKMRVCQEFSTDYMAQRVYNLYDECLTARARIGG